MEISLEYQPFIGQHEYPAVSILVPTHPKYPEFKVDREHMISLVSQAEDLLRAGYSKKLADSVLDRVYDTVNQINYTHLTEGLAVYVSPHHSKVIRLPFAVKEKVIVDTSFEVRDLIQAAKMNREYLLVMITKNGVRTLLGYGKSFMSVRFREMPDNVADVTNSHSFPGWDYLDTEAYDENNFNNFLQWVDKTLNHEGGTTSLPMIVIGSAKTIGYMRSHSLNRHRILGYIEGNYEHINTPQLRELIRPILEAENRKDEDDVLRQLAHAVSKDSFAAGITQVWETLKQGNARTLLVEESYVQPAHYTEEGLSISVGELVPGSHHNIGDAVDDAIEMALQEGVAIHFVHDGRLNEFNRIAVVKHF